MKKFLSLLLAFVFLQAQSWALSGGPIYPNTSQSYVGTYAGILIPKSLQILSGGSSSGATTAAIGLFTVDSPSTGIATGSLLVFIDGAPFTGTIDGLIDTSNGRFHALVSATSNYQVTIFVPQTTTANGTTTTTFTSQNFSVSATGSVNAKIKPSPKFTTQGSATQANQITGSAELDVFFQIKNDGTPDVTKVADFAVDGFQQSTTSSTATAINFSAGSGSSGTSSTGG